MYATTTYPTSPEDGFESQFWKKHLDDIQQGPHDYKLHQLPLARIKKVMKTDEDVKMISAEAPILFSKACDIFITELTLRAWQHATENKRRTLQRSDVATAISKSDMLDFLIDIVPRDEYSQGLAKPTDLNYRGMGPPYAPFGYGLPAGHYGMAEQAAIGALHQPPHLSLSQQQQTPHSHLFMQPQLLNERAYRPSHPEQRENQTTPP